MIGGAGDDVLTVTVAKGSKIFGDSGTNPDYNGRTKESDEDYLRQKGSRHEGWIIEYSYSYTEDRDYAPSDGADRIDMQLCSDYCRIYGEGGDDVVSVAYLDGEIELGEGDDTLTIDGLRSAQIDGDDGNDDIHVVETQYYYDEDYGYHTDGYVKIKGGAGDDTIAVDYAGGPNVHVYGGTGDDVLSVGGDGDWPVRIEGGGGDDACTFQGSALEDAACKFEGAAFSYSYCSPYCDEEDDAANYVTCPDATSYCNCIPGGSDCEDSDGFGLCDCDEAIDCCAG